MSASDVYANINGLPNETLTAVFELLGIGNRVRIEGVCRRWREIASSSCWNKTTSLFSEHAEELSALSYVDPVVILRRCGRNLKRLDLEVFAGRIGPEVIRSLLPLCPNLRYFNPGRVLLDHSLCVQLAECCPFLEEINLSMCCLWSQDNDVGNFLGGLHLKTVELGNLHQLKAVDLPFLSYSRHADLTTLTFGDIGNSLEVLNLGFIFMKNDGFDAIAKQCPQLVTFIIGECAVRWSINNARSCLLLASLKRLRKLCLKYCYDAENLVSCHIPAYGIQLCLRSIKTVTDLSLGFPGLELEDIQAIANDCQQLELLDLSDSPCHWIDLVELAKLPRLMYLGLPKWGYGAGENEAVSRLSEQGTLRVLLMGGVQRVTDETMMLLLNNCKGLTCLDISNCRNLSCSFLEALQRYVVRRFDQLEVCSQSAKEATGRSKDTVGVYLEKYADTADSAAESNPIQVRYLFWDEHRERHFFLPFEPFSIHYSNQDNCKIQSETLELHVWWPNGKEYLTSTRENAESADLGDSLLKIYSESDDVKPFFLLSHESFRRSSPPKTLLKL